MTIPLKNIEENPVALRAVNKGDEEYKELRDSIRENGVLCSITVVPKRDATGTKLIYDESGAPIYRLVDGLHRVTASRDAGLDAIPAQVLDADDAKVYKLQLIANSHKVETQHVQYAKHLHRILATDPTMTAIQLCKELSKSPQWLNDRLGLIKLDERWAKLVDQGSISVSNAVELAKLKPEEQEAFVTDAMNESTAVFGPKVKARIKAINEAKRAGRDPNAVTEFVAVAHQRKFAEQKEAFANPSALVEQANRAGISTVEDAIKFVLAWNVHMDAASIAKGKADDAAHKAEQAAAKEKRAADRAAKKAAESAAKKDAVI